MNPPSSATPSLFASFSNWSNDLFGSSIKSKTGVNSSAVNNPQIDGELKRARDLAKNIKTADEAFNIYSALAYSGNGNTEAMKNLGLLYLQERGVPPSAENRAKGIECLENAAVVKADVEALEALKILYSCNLYDNKKGILKANNCESNLVGLHTLAEPASCDQYGFRGGISMVEQEHLDTLKTVLEVVARTTTVGNRYQFEERLAHFDQKTKVASGGLTQIFLWLPPRNGMAGGSIFLEDVVRWTENVHARELAKAINERFIESPVVNSKSGRNGTRSLHLDPARLNLKNIKHPTLEFKLVAPALVPVVTVAEVAKKDAKPVITPTLSLAQLRELKTGYINIIVKKLKLLIEWSPLVEFLNEVNVDYINEELDSICLFSNLPEEDAKKVAYSRDVVHLPNSKKLRPNEQDNQILLKSAGSAIRLGGSGSEYIKENNQVSILQRTTMFDKEDGTVSRPYVLSVSAPAMDDTTAKNNAFKSISRPEIETYLAADGKFLSDKHKTAHVTLGQQIVDAAKKCDAKRVVLCAYGTGAFLEALGYGFDREVAIDNFIEVFVKTVLQLRADNREVVITDAFVGSRFASVHVWMEVGKRLVNAGSDPIKPVNGHGPGSAVAGGWAKDTDMIVNAWDPDSLIGNGLEQDKSFDGYIGRITTLNFVHAAACRAYQDRMSVPQIK